MAAIAFTWRSSRTPVAKENGWEHRFRAAQRRGRITCGSLAKARRRKLSADRRVCNLHENAGPCRSVASRSLDPGARPPGRLGSLIGLSLSPGSCLFPRSAFMSTVSPPEPRPRPETPRSRPGQATSRVEPPSWGLRVIDVCLIALFLALTFLLGIFPLKDADYYWHLRTGDLIRQTGSGSSRRFLYVHAPGHAVDRSALDLPGGH